MHLFFLLALFVTCSKSHALNWQYREWTNKNVIPYPTSSMALMVSKLKSLGWQALDSDSQGALRPIGFDQLLTHENSPQKLIIINTLIKPTEQNMSGKLVKVGNHLLYHGKTVTEYNLTINFFNFKAIEAQNLLRTMDFSVSQNHVSIFSLFISKAQASENCGESGNIRSVAAFLESDFLKTKIKECFAESLQQAAKILTLDLKDLLVNPLALWDSVVVQAKAAMQAAQHLSEYASNAMNAIKGLGPELLSQYLCQKVIRMGPQMLKLMLGGGAASVAIILLAELKSLHEKANVLLKLERVFRTNPKLAKEVLACQA